MKYSIQKKIWLAGGVVILGLGTLGNVSAAETTPIITKARPAINAKSAEVQSAPAAQAGEQITVEEKPASPPSPEEIAKAQAFEKTLNEADVLINAGKPAEAFQLLAPFDFEYSGNVRFDYLLGISALDSGSPDKATLAFERVLAVDPNFAGARLDMARAYFSLGDMPRARTEFEAVMKQDPPEAAKLTIEKYLLAIADSEKSKNLKFSAYVETSVGRDTNVNNSTDQSKIAVPAFGNLVFTLNPTNRKQADFYYTAAAGADISYTFAEQWGVYAGLDYRMRGNKKLTDFDTDSIDTRAGASLTLGDHAIRMGGTYGRYNTAGVPNRNSYGITSDYKYSFNATNQFNLFGQYGMNRFIDTIMQANDFDQTVLGTGFMHMFEDGKTVVFTSLNMALEKSLHDRADGDKQGYGVRVGGQTSFTETTETFTNLGYTTGSYDKENVSFLASRSDTTLDVAAGLNWHPFKIVTIRPQVSYSNNKSNIPIYSFDRVDASLTLRLDF
ncbi:MAG: surface lipoprotein assembly modifier [Gallionellaceae bacterium]|jgi:tetratricopeptide (TPR) repeat protein